MTSELNTNYLDNSRGLQIGDTCNLKFLAFKSIDSSLDSSKDYIGTTKENREKWELQANLFEIPYDYTEMFMGKYLLCISYWFTPPFKYSTKVEKLSYSSVNVLLSDSIPYEEFLQRYNESYLVIKNKIREYHSIANGISKETSITEDYPDDYDEIPF